MNTEFPTQAERDTMWTPLHLSIFRLELRERPATAAVVGVIIERERDVTIEQIAEALGLSVPEVSGYLSDASWVAAKAHGLPHREGTFPWLVRVEDGQVIHRCPEHVAKALR